MRSIAKRERGRGVWLGLGIAGVMAWTLFAGAEAYGASSEADLGKKVYASRCGICHGDKGDGKGLVGIIHRVEKRGLTWVTYPRDFTAGIFKFRSTMTGELPTDADLDRVIRNGIPRSGMPSHIDVPSNEIKAVIAYIKSFSPRWKQDKPGKSIAIKKSADVGSGASVAKGEKLWKDMKCWECHGEKGLGDGPSVATLKDDWGDPSVPFDFTSGALKGGPDIEDIYRTFTTGVDGSPMPSYADSLGEADRWHLVSYSLKLMGKVK